MEQKKDETIAKFSLTDFLAYLFPGAFGFAAIIIILNNYKLITVIFGDLIKLAENAQIFLAILTGSIGIAISYILGILFSGLLGTFEQMVEDRSGINPFEHKYTWHLKAELINIMSTLGLSEILQEINKPETSNSNDKKKRNKLGRNIFYILRAIVRAEDQNVTIHAERQSSLRQIRRNLVVPLFLWAWALLPHIYKSWISLLIFGVFYLFFFAGIFYGTKRNRDFETRDYCLGAWWIFKRTQLFPDSKITPKSNTHGRGFRYRTR